MKGPNAYDRTRPADVWIQTSRWRRDGLRWAVLVDDVLLARFSDPGEARGYAGRVLRRRITPRPHPRWEPADPLSPFDGDWRGDLG